MKLPALLSNPAIENSFTSPATHQGAISVVFQGKGVSIHGWDGSAWTTIYTWNGLDPQFKFENTYQSYYLKSLTGSEESMGVSFFSVEAINNSMPAFAGINRDTKLHDIEEVPMYRPSDENKMLTIMSDGSLRWLLGSETYMIDGSPAPSGGPPEYVFSEMVFTKKNGVDLVPEVPVGSSSGNYWSEIGKNNLKIGSSTNSVGLISSVYDLSSVDEMSIKFVYNNKNISVGMKYSDENVGSNLLSSAGRWYAQRTPTTLYAKNMGTTLSTMVSNVQQEMVVTIKVVRQAGTDNGEVTIIYHGNDGNIENTNEVATYVFTQLADMTRSVVFGFALADRASEVRDIQVMSS